MFTHPVFSASRHLGDYSSFGLVQAECRKRCYVIRRLSVTWKLPRACVEYLWKETFTSPRRGNLWVRRYLSFKLGKWQFFSSSFSLSGGKNVKRAAGKLNKHRKLRIGFILRFNTFVYLFYYFTKSAASPCLSVATSPN